MRPTNSAPQSALARSTITRSKDDLSNEAYAVWRLLALVTENPRASSAPRITREGAPSLNIRIRCDRNIQDRNGGPTPAAKKLFQLAQITQVSKTIKPSFVYSAPA